MDLKLKNYSSGMLVRLAFSVTIQVDADVLLIDEVLAVGDAAFQQKCFDEFNRLRDEGRTILLVTHDMSAVERFCDRAMLLEQRRGRRRSASPTRSRGEYHETELRARRARRTPTAAADRRPTHGDGTRRDRRRVVRGRATGERVDALAQGRRAAFVAVVRFVERASRTRSSAFSLETDDGDIVFATSTLWTSERTGSFAAGRASVGFRVAFDNCFAPGRYHADAVDRARAAAARTCIDRRERPRLAWS